MQLLHLITKTGGWNLGGYAGIDDRKRTASASGQGDDHTDVERFVMTPPETRRGVLGLGEKDNAFKWLDKTLEERWGPFNELSADPMFDSLRADARFAALLRRMGLPAGS